MPRFLDSVDPAYLARLERGRAAQRRRPARRRALRAPRRSDYFNSVVSLGASPRQRYHKLHLVPFGEFVPPGFGWIVRVLADSALRLLARRARSARRSRSPGSASPSTSATRTRSATRSSASCPRRRCSSTSPTSPGSATRSRRRSTCRSRACARSRPAACTSPPTNTGITAVDRPRRARRSRACRSSPEGRLDAAVHGYAGATPYVRCAATGRWSILCAAASSPRRRSSPESS